MAGTLEAKANPGPGATVSFELAAAAAEARPRPTPAASAEPARSAHILVVDDNATNRMVVEALCEMFDCSTESVVDGVEAVEAAKAGRYDVILMDIKMPRMDGVTATREIRKLPGAGRPGADHRADRQRRRRRGGRSTSPPACARGRKADQAGAPDGSAPA